MARSSAAISRSSSCCCCCCSNLGSSELRSLTALQSSGCGPRGHNVVRAPILLAGWVYGPGPAESGRHQCRAPQQDVPRDVRLLTADEAQTRRTVDVIAPGALCGRLLANPVQVLGGPRLQTLDFAALAAARITVLTSTGTSS